MKRHSYYQKSLVLFICIVCAGCVSGNSIARKYNRIYYEDGVDRWEGRVIAQQKLLAREDSRSYAISIPLIDEKEDAWEVTFTSKTARIRSDSFRSVYVMEVDKITGKILREYASQE